MSKKPNYIDSSKYINYTSNNLDGSMNSGRLSSNSNKRESSVNSKNQQKNNEIYETFLNNYYAFDYPSRKKTAMEAFLKQVSSFDQNTFHLVYENIQNESKECLYRMELFDSYIDLIKTLHTTAFYNQIVTINFIESFIDKCDYLEYIGRMICELSLIASLKKTTITKISEKINRNSNRINELCHTEIVNRFIAFKMNNQAQAKFKILNKHNPIHFKKMIFYIYQYLYKECIDYLQPENLSVMLKWLIMLNPKDDIQEYELVDNISKSCIKWCQDNHGFYIPNKLHILLTEIFHIMKINLKEKDILSEGFSNIIVILDLLEDKDLISNINQNFEEIVNNTNCSIETFLIIFENIIKLGITNGACTIIYQLSVNFSANVAWPWLYEILNKIILKYVLDKVRIIRCSLNILTLLRFYLIGFIKYLQITKEFINNINENLNYLMISTYKTTNNISENENLREILKEYMDLIYVLINLKENTIESTTLKELKELLNNINQEFNFKYTPKSINNMVIQAKKNLIFDITEYDLKVKSHTTPIEELLQKYRTDQKHKGLLNLGNTCYINSTIQALFMTVDFRTKILSNIKPDNSIIKRDNNNSSTKKGKKNLNDMELEEIKPHEALNQLYLELLSSKDSYVDPTKFRESLPEFFRATYQQQDASEFIKIYLDSLEASLANTQASNLIDECFAGENIEIIECCDCQQPKKNHVKYLDLILNFDKIQKSHDLLKMIKKTYSEEEFINENKFFCDKCQKHSELTIKKTEINKLPANLIITLNRFYYDQASLKRYKICNYVKIYEYFDFKDIFEELNSKMDTAYKIYAILVHSGNSAEGGHYYIFAREFNDPKIWFLFNDTMVLALGNINFEEYFKEKESETPYMVFYKRDTKKKIKSLQQSKARTKEKNQINKTYYPQSLRSLNKYTSLCIEGQSI